MQIFRKMKKIKNIALFLSGIVIIILLIDIISYTDFGDNVLGRVFFATGYRRIGSVSIVPAIEKCQKRDDYSKLILGDSVCGQVFNSFAADNDDYLILGTNQAITVTGQYILAHMFMEAHPKATDIYIVLLPSGFASSYSSERSYSYLVEPFGRKDCLQYLSDTTIEGMRNLYGDMFLKSNVIKMIDDSCINNKLYLYYNQERIDKLVTTENGMISSESKYYLKKLAEECQNNGIELHLLASPIIDTPDAGVLFDSLKKDVECNELNGIFEDYFLSAKRYNASMFSDGVHFLHQYSTEEDNEVYIDAMRYGSHILQGLVY